MKKSRGKFLKVLNNARKLRGERVSSESKEGQTIDREYMRKVINDAIKLPKQDSAYGIDFYYGSGIFEGMRHRL